MSTVKNGSKPAKSPRLLFGLIIVIIQFILLFILPNIIPEALIVGILGGSVCGIIAIIWWMFFSRIPMLERWGGLLAFIAVLFLTYQITDISIVTANMGYMYYFYSLPLICITLTIWALSTKKSGIKKRRIWLGVSIVMASALWLIIRIDGIDGEGLHDFNWRWAQTDEEQLLEQNPIDFFSSTIAKFKPETDIEWPGFRGTDRNSAVHGISINTNWDKQPPKELWKKKVGPGCSSFAVRGNYFYTQEQRGELELVSCYKVATGEPVWIHEDSARFWDSHAGAGPRATPTLAGNRVYTMGATGILNVLDARTGELIWMRNAAEELVVDNLTWAFCGSPVVVDSIVVISLSGKMAGYDINSGEIIWQIPNGGVSYSSPQYTIIDSISQVVMMNFKGATSVDPYSGAILWEYNWQGDARILQPAIIDEGELILTNEINSQRRIRVEHSPGQWDFEELWTSTAMKPNFNDFVIHNDCAYGFDGPFLTCININDGSKMWKGDRLRGWIILIADQDLLLVLTEKGDLTLVDANPEEYIRHNTISIIEGKTWNHPAMAGNIYLARNSQEMAAYEL